MLQYVNQIKTKINTEIKTKHSLTKTKTEMSATELFDAIDNGTINRQVATTALQASQPPPSSPSAVRTARALVRAGVPDAH